jgi:hypothetical protein
MDFNYFYHRQQVSLIRAQAASGPARAAHQGLADLYSALISRGQSERGAPSATFAAGAVLR